MIHMFNKTLKQQATHQQLSFLDLYALTADGSGSAKDGCISCHPLPWHY